MKEIFVAARGNDEEIKTDYDKLLELVRANGMDYKWAQMFVKKLYENERAFAPSEEVKKFAFERGFYPGRVEMYNLTEENYQDYLPDYSYFMTHPLNHHFRKWLDKLTLKYVLNSNGCEESMPKYYLYVENNGNYTYLMDLDSDIPKNKDFILNLLKEKGSLIIKPNSGSSGGRGIMKLEWKNNEVWLNNHPITLDEFYQDISSIGNNIVTEYCHQHSDLAKIWPDSECTLRVVMAKLPYTDPYGDAVWHNTVSYARFGAEITGGASNLSAGGIGIGFDFETGYLKDYGIRLRRFCPDGNYMCYEHPDTHVQWKGFRLPNWDYCREMIRKVCNHVASLDYLGLDIIITQDGMKLCEINTHPAADYEQIMCGPILKDPKSREFFAYHGLYTYDTKDFWKMYQESQKK